jgi:hypothetical protein
MHKYHSRFFLKGVAEASQMSLRDAYVLPILLSYEEYCTRGRSQSISGVSAVNSLVAFYDIHGTSEEVLFFCFFADSIQ